jgi:hypothetical protein
MTPYEVSMTRAFVLALLIFAFGASAAQAQNAPPGNSGVDEYLEAVPAATGSKAANKTDPKGSGGAVLTQSQQKALDAQGADGAAAAALAQRLGTERTGQRHETKKHRSGTSAAAATTTTSTPAPKASGDSVFSSLSKTVLPVDSSSGGLGPALPIILIAIAAAGAGALVVRHRRPS